MPPPSLRAALALGVLAAAAGCSAEARDDVVTSDETSESEVRVAELVVVADPGAILAAEVSPDAVRLPASAGEHYRTLAPGTIFVGARGGAGTKNPDGFLRRVAGVTTDGSTIVVATRPATLTDAIVDGAITTSSGGGKVDDHLTAGTVDAIELDLRGETLFENVDAVEADGKRARFAESIRLDRARLSARPSVDVDLRIAGGRVERFVAKVEGNLDASIQAVATVSSEGDVDAAVLDALKEKRHAIERVLFRSKRIALPTFSAGKVPVSPSVELRVTLTCDLAFGGAVNATAGVEARSFVRLGGVWENGAWGEPIRSEFDIRPSFTLSRGAELDARCAFLMDAELFVYGTSGITMSVAPYLDFDVELGRKKDFGRAPFVWQVHAGATGGMHGQSGVFGLPAEVLERELVEWEAGAPLEGVAE